MSIYEKVMLVVAIVCVALDRLKDKWPKLYYRIPAKMVEYTYDVFIVGMLVLFGLYIYNS